jgi:phospholipid/cholesterol/gamma-HCH transport system substrate-binding protein
MRFAEIPRGSAQRMGMSPFRAGLLALVVIMLFSYFGFTKQNPFADPYEVHALFESANRIGKRSPVRIAGVTVGKVTKVEAQKDGSGLARVTMEIKKEGLPIHKDAQFKIRSRLFLEGNYFVDIQPGRAGSPELESGSTIPPSQTASPVQFSQLLTALQSDTRDDLRTLLREYSEALRGKGARGFNEAIRWWEPAYRDTSQVQDATLGTKEHDLTRVLDGQSKVFGALASDQEALKTLVTGLAQTLSGFAREEDNLRMAIPELRDVLREGRPALASLNRALPSIRGFARDALPGARSSSSTLDAQIPFIKQARRLMARRELGGLARQLRRTVPSLVSLNKGTTRTLAQNRALASCQNNVLLPFAKSPINDPDFDWHTGEPWYEEQARALVGLSGESRISDANSPMFRVLGGGGPTTIVQPGTTFDAPLYGQNLVPIDGVRPARPSKRPGFQPDQPCEIQDPPNLAAVGGPGDQQVTAKANVRRSAREQRERRAVYRRLREFSRRALKGLPALDPLVWFDEGEKLQRRRLKLEKKP